jgi:uncharacterized membrane protein
MASIVTNFLLFAIITILRLFLTLSLALLDKTCPEKSNGTSLMVIGHTMFTQEQCE